MARRNSLPWIATRPAGQTQDLVVQASAPLDVTKQLQLEATASWKRDVVRRSLSGIPKSAGATSSLRRSGRAEVSVATGKQLDGIQFQQQQPRPHLQRPSSTQSPPKRSSSHAQVAHAGSTTAKQFAKCDADRLAEEDLSADNEDGSQRLTSFSAHSEALSCNNGEKSSEGPDPQHFQQLRNENMSLQQEVSVLRMKLVEKMRGRSKVIGGGQFRAISASNPSPAKMAIAFPSAACSKCASARAGALKARHQHAQAQANAVELQKYVAKVESMKQTLWTERVDQQAEISQLKCALAERDEECVAAQADRTLLERQLRALRMEKEALASANSDNNNPSMDETTQCALHTHSQRDYLLPASQDAVEGLQEELRCVMKQRDGYEKKLQIVMADLHKAQEAMREEKERRRAEAQERSEEAVVYARQVSELEQSLAALQERTSAATLELRETHCQETQGAQEMIQQLRGELAAKDAALVDLSQQHAEDLLACEVRQEARLKELEDQVDCKTAAESDLQVRLKAATGALTAATAAKDALQERVKDLEHHSELLEREKRQSEAQILQQQARDRVVKEERAKIERLWKEQSVELLRLTEARDAAQQEIQELQARASNAEFDLSEHSELLQKLKKSHAHALERAAQSAVRLCVVAPTVNVHLNTNGAKTIGDKGTSSSDTSSVGPARLTTEVTPVTCHSSPSREKIRQVVEKEVLPLFTSVFVQDGEDPSPKTDGVMTPWLEKLLLDMQTRIASQLEGIYTRAT